MRKIALFFVLGMMLIRMSVVPEALAYITHVDTYLLYIVGPPAILFLVLCGGIGRAFRAPPILLWSGMAACMLLSVPTSSWIGGSSERVLAYAKTDFICLFAFAGAIYTWQDARKALKVMAVAGFVIVLIAALWARPGGDGRLTLDMGGTIANPNDLAAHLILLLPFLGLFATSPGRSSVVKYLTFGCIFFALWQIVGTASRGAMIAVAVMFVFIFIRGKSGFRALSFLGLPLLIAGTLIMAPDRVLIRLASLFVADRTVTSASSIYAEADESTASRQYLLEQSIKFTLQHPLFGVGAGQFSNFEGQLMKGMGKTGNWHETHNSYTQISSECGVPALAFMVSALVGTFIMVNRTYRRAQRLGHSEIREATMYYLCAQLGYCVCVTFLACGYRFTLPALISLGVALRFAGERELDLYAETRPVEPSPFGGELVRIYKPTPAPAL